MTTNGRAYWALVKVYEETGWPERYVTDLFKCDAGMLGFWPGATNVLPDGMPFGWILRRLGTWLVPANINPNADSMAGICKYSIDRYNEWFDKIRRDEIAAEMMNCPSCEELNYRYFWWDGETIREVYSPAAILDRIRHYQENKR